MKKVLLDGWNNIMLGLGGNKDATNKSQYNMDRLKSFLRDELNALYSTNWIASKVVDIPVDDALKDDRIISTKNPEDLKVFEKAYKSFNIDDKVKNLGKWSRAFGGAVIIIVTDDDKMDTPLIIENLKQGQLKNLVVLDRFDITNVTVERDPLSRNYLKPLYYQLANNATNIHYSRVIHLDGDTTTNYNKDLLNGWGLSIYEKAWNTLYNATVSPDLLSNILLQSNQDVYKIAGLNEAITNDQDELVTKRLEVIQQSKSIFNGIALDKEDDYINIAKNFSGLDAINKAFFENVSGAFDIPYSRLMGISSTGLNVTGDGDLSNYYDSIEALRDTYKRVYDIIDKVMQYHLFGKDIGLTFEWASLWQLSDLEQAQLDKANADVDNLYFNMGVVTELDIKSKLVKDNRYPTITAESVQQEIEMYQELENVSEETENSIIA